MHLNINHLYTTKPCISVLCITWCFPIDVFKDNMFAI